MFSKKELIIRFELNREVLQEISSNDIKSQITIGRNPNCVWVIPPTDKSASGNHAILAPKGGGIVIADLKSKNGIFYKGERITERKLSAGDQIRIGDCVLTAELPGDSGARKSFTQFNQLEQLNGEEKGKIYELNTDLVRIGSSAECEIALSNSVISHIHATVQTHLDGSCWIKDNGSRNGTQVNGVSLSNSLNDEGRMLKDGDVITISYIDLRFLDKYTQHVRSHIGLKIVAVIITLAIGIGGYFAWLNVTPSAKTYIERARLTAQQENFQDAREILKGALNARSYDTYKKEIAELNDQLNRWEDTRNKWVEIKKLFADSKWVSANKILSPLLSNNMELWKWNDSSAAQAKNEAILVKRINDAFLAARATLQNEDSTSQQIDDAIATLSHELQTIGGNVPEFCQAVLQAAQNVLTEISTTSGELKAIDATLAGFKDISGLPAAVQQLNAIQTGAVQRHEQLKKSNLWFSKKVENFITNILEPLNKLSTAQQAYFTNAAAAAALQFDQIANELPLPSIQECAVYPILVEKRSALVELHQTFLADVRQLQNLSSTLTTKNLTIGKVSPEIQQILTPATIDAVLACDIFKYNLPRRSRTEPAGTYDSVLGFEIFYNFLTMLPADFDSASLEDAPFKPAIYTARQDFGILEDFIRFWERDSLKVIRDVKANNQAAELVLHADELIQKRDSLVIKLKKQSLESEERDGVIAGGIAILLGQRARLLPREFPDAISAKLRDIRTRTNAIANQEVTPEQAIANRQKVLDIGIPGDSIVKKCWSEIKR